MSSARTTLIFILIIMLVNSVGLLGQDKSSKLVITDSIFNFGFFASDARVVHTFHLRNDGDDTLRIIKVKPSCGCTTAPLHNYNIAPNDSTTLDLYFDSKRLTGLVKKKVTILSNDPVSPLKEIGFIAITSKPHPYLKAKPEVLNFGRLSIDKLDKPYEVKLTNIIDEPVELNIVDRTFEYINAELKDSILQPGETTTLEMTLFRIPNDPSLYNFSTTISANIKGVDIYLSIPAVGRLNRLE
jgi:Protein of unknown function (DUF1573)